MEIHTVVERGARSGSMQSPSFRKPGKILYWTHRNAMQCNCVTLRKKIRVYSATCSSLEDRFGTGAWGKHLDAIHDVLIRPKGSHSFPTLLNLSDNSDQSHSIHFWLSIPRLPNHNTAAHCRIAPHAISSQGIILRAYCSHRLPYILHCLQNYRHTARRACTSHN